MNWVRLLLLLLLVLPVGHSAKIVGVIYDHDLEPIKQTVLTVNTTPEQTKVSRYGGYHFFLEPGTYKITATLTRNNITKEIAHDIVQIPATSEEISRDLFIYENFDMNEEFQETWLTKLLQSQWLAWALAIIAFAAFAWVSVYYILRFKKGSEQPKVDKPEITPANPDAMLEKRIFVILKKNGGQVTQKKIRKEFKLSEAKISLAIQKLNDEGKLEKVKQGRVNVIRLK